MAVQDRETLVQLARESPAQTGLLTVGPIVIALLQLANSYIHDSSLILAGVFAMVMLVYSVLATQYHLAVHRRTSLL